MITNIYFLVSMNLSVQRLSSTSDNPVHTHLISYALYDSIQKTHAVQKLQNNPTASRYNTRPEINLSSYHYSSQPFIFNWTCLSMTKHVHHHTKTLQVSESGGAIDLNPETFVCVPRSKWLALINQPHSRCGYLLWHCQSKRFITTDVPI